MGHRRWHCWVLIFICNNFWRVAADGEMAKRGDVQVKGKKTLLWPIHLTKLPLSTVGHKSLETPEFGQALKDIGLKGFQKYLRTTLPTELEKDEPFANNFNTADHSRVNLAFRRWQARAFASHEGIPIKRITQQGDTSPKLDGVNYSWPELYDSPQFKRLLGRIKQLTKVYMKRSGYDAEETKQSFLIVPWVEVFSFGESLRPMSRSDGAYLFGRYFAWVDRGALKFNFEDPRGINPPYGKTYSDSVYDGEICLLPSWVSTFVTPNMQNNTAVIFAFLVYPEKGRLQWRGDKTGDIKLESEFTINKKR